MKIWVRCKATINIDSGLVEGLEDILEISKALSYLGYKDIVYNRITQGAQSFVTFSWTEEREL